MHLQVKKRASFNYDLSLLIISHSKYVVCGHLFQIHAQNTLFTATSNTTYLLVQRFYHPTVTEIPHENPSFWKSSMREYRH